MNKNIMCSALLVAAMAGFTTTTACGATSSGNFTELSLGTGIVAEYVQGPYKPVQIVGDKEAVKNIRVTTDDSSLKINYVKNNGGKKRDGVKVIVQAPSVHDFEISVGASLSVSKGITSSRGVEFEIGTGGVVTVGAVVAPKVEIDCSTGGAVSVKGIKARRVELDCSTGAVAELSGTTDFLEIDSSTGSQVKARNLRAENGTVDAGTGATVDVNIRNLQSCDKSMGASVTNHAR